MPKVKCECGYIFNLSKDTDAEYSLIREDDIRQLLIDASRKSITADEIEMRLDKHAKGVLICPSCNRMLVDAEGNGFYEVYVPIQGQQVHGPNVYGDRDLPP